MTLDELQRDLDTATKAGDLELSRAIASKIDGLSAAPSPAKAAAPAAAPPMLNDPAVDIAQNPLTRFAVGAGKSAVGAGQFLSNLAFSGMSPDLNAGINKVIWDPLTKTLKRTEDMGALPEDGWNVAGTAGEVLSPVGLGLGKGLAAAPKLGGKLAQGISFGSGLGAAQPVTGDNYDEAKLAQIGAGGAAGGTFPLLGAAMKFVGRPVSEFFTYMVGPEGAAKLATRHTNEVVGPENVQKLVTEIQSQLPGSGLGGSYRPTTGEMVSHMPESTGWQAIQNNAARSPQGSVGYGQRALEQRQAIEGAMAPIAGTETQLASAIKARGAAANADYGDAAAAGKLMVDDEMKAIAQNPYFRSALGQARAMARAAGTNDTTSVLHNVKVILDAQLGKTGNDAVNRSERKLIGDLQRDLVGWMENANPAYADARAAFQDASVPINRMQVGQELQSKMFAPTDQMTPGAYLRALDDAPKLIRDATGRPRGSLDQVFDPAQASTLREVGGLLERKLAQQKPLQPTTLGSATDTGAKIDLPHMLSTPIVFANYVIRTMSGGTGGLEAGVQRINALRGLYPEQFVEAMKTVPPTKRQEIMTALANQGITPMNQGLIAPAAQGLFGFQNQ